ncbi:MAG TPA: PhoH family protein, partial [Bacteroidales bacterium]|nr:PhoH family protein [Bacteroidales bacterium]
MTEKKILIDVEDLAKFFGLREVNLSEITKAFPRLKIVVRGDILKVSGEKDEIELFETKFQAILEHYHNFNRLTVDDIKQIISSDEHVAEQKMETDVLLYSVNGKPIKARTKNQKKLVEEFKENDLLFAVGPAGTGKTYTAIALAVQSLKELRVKRIILSRPAVEAGENLGFLPGDLREKLDPYLQP